MPYMSINFIRTDKTDNVRYLKDEIKRAEECGIFELGNDWQQAHHMGMKIALKIIESDLIKKVSERGK